MMRWSNFGSQEIRLGRIYVPQDHYEQVSWEKKNQFTSKF